MIEILEWIIFSTLFAIVIFVALMVMSD